MTTRYHGNKMSGSQPFFLREKTICVVLVCNHGQESHTCYFFFCDCIFAGPWFVEIQKFLLPWKRDVTTCLYFVLYHR